MSTPARACMWIVVAGVLGVVACAAAPARVDLPPAPSSDAPFPERAAYWRAHAVDARGDRHVVLRDGARVEVPQDLLPAVAADSDAAQAIGDHAAARARVDDVEWLRTTTAVVAYSGLGATAVGLIGFFLPRPAPPAFDVAPFVVIGGLATGAGLLVVAGGAQFAYSALVADDERRATEAARRAFRAYPDALRDRLGVAVDEDGRPVDARPIPPAPPAPPALPASRPADDGGVEL